MSDVYEHNKRVLATLVEGDAVEFKRIGYSHWGIYIGNEKVIHVTGIGEGGSFDASNISHISSVSGKRFNKATVRIDNLFHVASGCKAEKNNSKDIKFPPRPVHEIIEKAMAMIGDIDYNVFSQNCEHFVSYCRNNIQVSDQVDTAKQTAIWGILVALIEFIFPKLRLHKRQQNPLIGCQKDDKYDKDKGPDSHEIPDTSHNDNRETNTHILKTDFNDGGPDLGAPNHNVGGNTIDQVSTSEYQKQVSDDNTDADISTTPVADVRTENYSSGHFSDEKKEVGLAGSEVLYVRKCGTLSSVNKEKSSSCQNLGDKRQNTDPQFGSQSDDKYDKDKGPDSHEIFHNDNREININILKTDSNDGGPDLGAPNYNVNGNTIDQVSTSEYQKQVSDVNTDADISTTPVADVRTENYSSGHFSDEKKEVGLAGSEVLYVRKSGILISVNKEKSSSCQNLGDKRQNTDPQFGSQSDNKNDIDSGLAGFNNLASVDDSIYRVNIAIPFVTYLNADGFDFGLPVRNVGGNKKYLVSSSEAQHYVTDVHINANDSTTNVVDVGTVHHSKSRLTDGKTEDCVGSVGDYIEIWPGSRGTDDNTWKLSSYQTKQNAVPHIGSKIYDNSDKDEGILDSVMDTFRGSILDPYVIVSDFQHLHTDNFTVSDYPICNRYIDSLCLSPRHNELKVISVKEVEPIAELESRELLRQCKVLDSISFNEVFHSIDLCLNGNCSAGVSRLLDPTPTDYEMCAMFSRPCPPLQTYVPMTCNQVGFNFTQAQGLLQ